MPREERDSGLPWVAGEREAWKGVERIMTSILLAALVAVLAVPAGSGDGIELVPAKLATDEKELDAVLPPQEVLGWGQEPLEVISSRREQFCLNGIWQFVPMLETAETRPPGGIAYIRVPGSWQSGLCLRTGERSRLADAGVPGGANGSHGISGGSRSPSTGRVEP